MTLRIGTRRSALATTQTGHVADALDAGRVDGDHHLTRFPAPRTAARPRRHAAGRVGAHDVHLLPRVLADVRGDEVAGLLLGVGLGHLECDSAEQAASGCVAGRGKLLVFLEDDADVLALGVARWVAVVADVAWLCGVDCVVAALWEGEC